MLHTIIGGVIAATVFVFGVSAYHLKRRQHVEIMRKSFRMAMITGIAAGAMQFVVGDVLERRAGIDPGVIDEDVEPAVRLEGRIDRGLPLAPVGDVEGHEPGLAAAFGDLPLKCCASLFVDVAEDDGGALPGEPADGIEDVHFHVFEPRQVRLYGSLYF